MADHTDDPIADLQLRRAVEEELEWEPSVDARRIGVAVKNGIVTLAGTVSSYAEKWAAERAAERVRGVKGVVSEIEVRVDQEVTDPDIAKAAVQALQRNLGATADRIKVEVDEGWVTLRGEVEYEFERREAERSMREIPGLKGVVNLIAVRPGIRPDGLKEEIEAAFRRQAVLDANRIQVEIDGGVVILRGTVRSWVEREEAERVAWSAPGVTGVKNYIQVKPVVGVSA